MEYTVVVGDYVGTFEEQVAAHLRDGWELVGSLVVTEYRHTDRDGYSETTRIYHREMIRRQKPIVQ